MKKEKTWYLKLPILLPVGLLVALCFGCYMPDGDAGGVYRTAADARPAVEEKQRGAHVFGRPDSTSFARFHEDNIEWITLVPYSTQDDFDSPQVRHHNGDSLQMQYHDSSWTSQIEVVRAAGFKVFFKPHVWIRHPSDGKWRSDVSHASEEEWDVWKESYHDFILRYAKIAERAHAEMFCVGAEFTILSAEKPEFWRELIRDVRKVYSGKVTYAANWYQEYEKVAFWDELDYIGIQAYFPLVDNRNPTVEQISTGWGKHLPAIKAIQEKFGKQVLFTELGYKSTADSAIEPWEWIRRGQSNEERGFSLETQANCYQAFFDTVWDEEWFAGVHIWQLRANSRRRRERSNLDFTPLDKPAEGLIAKGFKRK